MQEKKRKLSHVEIMARAALLCAAILWGSTFVAVSSTNDFFRPNFLLAIRFLGAGFILSVIFFKKLKMLNKKYLITGLRLGVIMFAGYSLQSMAITTAGGLPGRCAFLVATYCVLVPFVNAAVSRTAPNRYNIIAAIICLTGILCISLPDLMSEKSGGMSAGDALSLLSSVVFAVYIVLLPKLIRDLDAVLITITQFAVAGICAALVSVLFENNGATVWNVQSVSTLLYLTVLCTAVCMLLETFGQKHTPAPTAALLFSLESVAGIAFSIIFTDERLTLNLIIGCICIFASIFISERKTAKQKAAEQTSDD